MLTAIGSFIEERTGALSFLSAFLQRKESAKLGYLYTLGAATLFLFLLQLITGAFLSLYYSPSPAHAYDSVQYITHEVHFGGFIRGLHHWSASGLILLVGLHALRTFFMAAYRYPRELTWIVGVGLLILVIGSGFTGYLLPWDQRAYWATMVGTSMANTVPLIGELIGRVMRGGEELGAVTLTRFYTAHVLILPGLTLGLVFLHLYLAARLGASEPPVRLRKAARKGKLRGAEAEPSLIAEVAGAGQTLAGREEQREYWRERERVRREGVAYYPYLMFRDSLAVLVVFLAVVLLAVFVGLPTEPRADPTDTTYLPKPEWYFLWLFELMKYLPGQIEWVASLLVPGALFLVLLVLPFVDRGRRRHPLDRPIATALGALVVMAILALSLMAAFSPTAVPLGAAAVSGPAASTELARGQAAFARSCGACHPDGGVGAGPALRGADFQSKFPSDAAIAEVVRKGQGAMPAFSLEQLSDEDLTAIITYLRSLE